MFTVLFSFNFEKLCDVVWISPISRSCMNACINMQNVNKKNNKKWRYFQETPKQYF